MYSHSSTNPANWVKIGPVDVQTKGLTESLKNTSPPSQRSDDVELWVVNFRRTAIPKNNEKEEQEKRRRVVVQSI